jgi:hypothetical protein
MTEVAFVIIFMAVASCYTVSTQRNFCLVLRGVLAMSKILAAGAIALLLSGYATASNWQTAAIENSAKKPKKTVAAPEIDSTSAGAALMLLAGGLIVVFSRKTVKKD